MKLTQSIYFIRLFLPGNLTQVPLEIAVFLGTPNLKIILERKGSGEIKVLLNNVVVGEISITDSKQQNKKIEFSSGKYELSLEFYGCTNLELHSIILG